MKQITRFLAPFILVTFFGCDYYYSDVPITHSGKEKIDTNLLGEWIVPEYTETVLYPSMVIRLMEFSETEYLAILQYLENEGQDIYEVTAHKIHQSTVDDLTYLNVQNIEDDEFDKKYSFWRLDAVTGDSIIGRFITDSLELKFTRSKALKKYIRKNSQLIEQAYLSDVFPFYSTEVLKWDFVNHANQTKDIEAFWLLEDRITEEALVKMDKASLVNLKKQELDLNLGRQYLRQQRLETQSPLLWNIPRYAVLLFENGSIMKLKISRQGNQLFDLTNSLNYRSSEEANWEILLEK